MSENKYDLDTCNKRTCVVVVVVFCLYDTISYLGNQGNQPISERVIVVVVVAGLFDSARLFDCINSIQKRIQSTELRS